MTSATTTEDLLRDLDESIDTLASRGEWEALSLALADDFIYSHSTGAVQDKTEWIQGLKPLVGRRDRVVSEARVEIHGDIAVVYGNVDIVWRDQPTKYNRYVRVYRQTGDNRQAWQAISQRTVPAYDREPE